DDGSGDRSVRQGAPFPAFAYLGPGGSIGPRIASVGRGGETRARAQDSADVLRQALVHPQQLATLRGGVVAGGKTDRATVFAIPGMRIFMRQQRGYIRAAPQIAVDER